MVQVFRNRDQFVGSADEDSPPAGGDNAPLFPAAEDPTDRMKCGSGDLTQILTRYRKVDQNSALDLAPGLANQTGESSGNASLYSFGGQFLIADADIEELLCQQFESIPCNDRFMSRSIAAPLHERASADVTACPALRYSLPV